MTDYFAIDGIVYRVTENPRFASHVHIKHGKLGGWCAHCTKASRHAALRSCVRTDGYATCIRRVNFLRAVKRYYNRHLRTVATEDLHWIEHEFKGSP
jgi:hypothetical protein